MSESSKIAPPPQVSAKKMLETRREFSCRHLSKWADLTMGSYKYQWLLWGAFDIPKLEFLKTRLYSNSAETKKEQRNACLETSDQDCESKVTFV